MLETEDLRSLEQIKAFLEGSASLDFEPLGRVAAELRGFGYAQLGKANKDPLRQYLAKVIGLTRTAGPVDQPVRLDWTGLQPTRTASPALSAALQLTSDT